jgi:hypothetical protein
MSIHIMQVTSYKQEGLDRRNYWEGASKKTPSSLWCWSMGGFTWQTWSKLKGIASNKGIGK